MSTSKSLLDKYHMPIEHLDFDYVRKCANAREIERILEILRSGEEGHYPQLTEFTENRLRVLDPANKVFRVEHNLVRNSNPICGSVQEDVDAFVTEVRRQSSSIPSDVDMDPFLPPIRKISDKTAGSETTAGRKSDRIKSCDYDRWNKYDPDTECLKMDLHEEKVREDLIQQKEKQQKLVEIIPGTNDNLMNQLAEAEKITIAERHRLKGNEFFRGAEYVLAISEYTKSLEFAVTAAALNNRAAANVKMQKYSQAISDCDECLSIEPNNVKAMLRRADALNLSGRGNDAYRQYARVLQLHPENSTAKKIMKSIPIRLEIEDIRPEEKLQTKITPKPAALVNVTHETSADYDDDLRKLIIPKKIVRSKLSQAVSSMQRLCSEQKSKKSPNQKQ